MSANSDSQCYFVQLQIDSYLDGDLSTVQQEVFMSHVHACTDCASEFRFAQTVQDAVLELPNIDCNESVLEPIHRLSDSSVSVAKPAEREPASLMQRFQDLFATAPLFLRYGFPSVVLVVVLAVSAAVIRSAYFSANQNVSFQQLTAEVEAQYAPEEIAQALQDLNLAIDYLNQVSRRTEVMIGDRFLVTPLQESFGASFQRVRLDSDPIPNGPI